MNTSVIIAVVILYEIVSIGGCALYLKMKERKHKGGQNTAGDDFSTGGQSMTWPVVGASLALSLYLIRLFPQDRMLILLLK